jgi:hypothetical protein
VTQDDTKSSGFSFQPDAPETPQATIIDAGAVALSVLWLVMIGVFCLFIDMDAATPALGGLRAIMIFVAIIMPLGLIWVGALAARTLQTVQQESRKLQLALEKMQPEPASKSTAANPSAVEKKLDEIAANQRKTYSKLTTFTSIRDAAPSPQPGQKSANNLPEEQPSLELGAPAESLSPPLGIADFIRAMNFPESPEDQDGFRALRRALSDRQVSQLIHAAQDILTLLSQDGIYMDDLHPDRAKPEIWRSFAQGERGRTMAALGGVRDPSTLALASGRMKQDAIFRDAVHHFLRKFDRIFAEFEANATDSEISNLADTRTARAFMLLGRIAGTFD